MKKMSVARLLALAAFLASFNVFADDKTDVERGRNSYRRHEYPAADERFKVMLDEKTGTVKDPIQLSEGLMLWGATKIALGKKDEAIPIFERLLTANGQYEPDPLSYPTEVLDVFSDTRTRIQERIAAQTRERQRLADEQRKREAEAKKQEAARVATLERLAGEETVREPHNRYVAFIPFGAGQFQNGDKKLGWIFLGTEAVFVAVGTALVPFYLAERRDMRDSYDPRLSDTATRDATSHRDAALNLQIANIAAFSAFALTAIGGIVQANFAYRPEDVRTQKRTMPPGMEKKPEPQREDDTNVTRLTPSVSAVTGGAVGGFSGRF